MRTFDYETLAKKKWDMDILKLVAQIHESKGRQDLFIRQKPVELDRLVEVAKIQSTESSNRIEGIITTATRMKQLLEKKTTPRNRVESEIVGYRDVLNTIHENYEYIPIRANYILLLHRDLLKNTGLNYGGHFKNVQNYINEIRPDGTSVTRFTPAAPYEIPAAIDAICESYNRSIALEIVEPLILIPSFILDFLCIHPFNDGNGRMSRLLTLLLLYQNGYQVGKYISVEKQIEDTKIGYYDVLQESDAGWDTGENDPSPFIKYILQIILACYREFENRVGILSETRQHSTAYDVVKAYAENHIGKFTSAEVVSHCPSVSRSSILAAIKKMTEEGIIKRFGKGRSTYYVYKG